MPTQNPSATIAPETFSVRRTIRIAAPLEAVWTAITDPAHISRWLGPTELSRFEVGAEGQVAWPDHPLIPLHVEAIDAPRSVTYRWNNDESRAVAPSSFDEATSTTFTFALEAVVGATQLTVVESGFDSTVDPTSVMASHQLGWTSELDELVELLEVAA